jgi:hypothetical protein
MLTRHWLKEDIYIGQPQLAWNKRLFSRAIEDLFTYKSRSKTDQEIISAIVYATDGGAAIVTEIALQQFRTMVISETLDLDSVSLFVTLIHELSETNLAPRPPLLYQGIIPSIITFLVRLPPYPSSEDSAPALHRCVMMATFLLIRFTQTINGPSFIVQALNKGILAAFVISWPRMLSILHSTASHFATQFFNVLKDYLVYRSVLRSLEKALIVVQRLHVSNCDAWTDFQQFASGRLGLKAEFDALSKSNLDPGFFGCANHDVRIQSSWMSL